MSIIADRYEVLGTLGTGGVAEVLRVSDLAIPGRTVALKLAREPSLNAELGAEFMALSRVQHPNLPQVFDFLPSARGGCAAYTLEEVTGETADVAVEAGDETTVLSIAKGLLRALAHIHSSNLIHGDIHPRNVLYDADTGVVKLLDLTPDSFSGAGMGALPFLAPERLTGSQPSPVTDIFSVGVTLHRLWTGQMPFPEYPRMPADGQPESVDSLGPWKTLVSSMLSERPEKRPQQVLDVLTELGRISSAEILPVTPQCVRFNLRHGPAVSVAGWPQSFLEEVQTSHLDSGHPGFLAVVGSLGSGKSSAIAELKRSLQSREDPGMTLHTVSADGDSPGGAIRRLVSQIPLELREGLPDDLRQSLRALLSDAILANDAIGDPEKVRERATDVLSRALLWFGQSNRLTLLIDDLDRTDALSWDVIQLTARTMVHTPENSGGTVIVVTSEASDRLDELVSELGNVATVLTPPPFDSDAVDRLFGQAFLGRKPTHRLVQAVLSSCGGNPLVICETVAGAMESGQISFESDQIDLESTVSAKLLVPEDAEHALNARMNAMGVPAQTVLVWLAHSSVPIPLKLLIKVLELDAQLANQLINALQQSDLARVQIDEEESCLMLAAPMLRKALQKKTSMLKDVYERLRAIEIRRLSLMGRVVAAHAQLDASNWGPVLDAAELLNEHGMASESLSLLQLVGDLSGQEAEDLAMRLGAAHAILGNDEAAIAAYKRLPNVASDRHIGILLVRRGNYRDGLASLGRAIKNKDLLALAECHHWMARAHMMLGAYDAALMHCQSAREHADKHLVARVSYVEGLVHYYRSDHSKASGMFVAALDHWQKTNRLVEQADTLNAMGLVKFRQAELEGALTLFEQALSLSGRSGDSNRSILTLMNVAIIYQEQGDYFAAESRYCEALSRARVTGHRGGIMNVTQNLGNLYRFLGRLDESVAHLEESLTLATKEQNRYLEYHVRSLLGEVAWLTDDIDGAVEQLQVAIDGFGNLGNVDEMADCERSMAEVLLHPGEVNRARKLVESALAKAQDTGGAAIEVLALVTLAEIELWAADGDLDRALSSVEQARERLGEARRPDLQWQVLFAQHRVRRARGETELALSIARDALDALDKLANELPEDKRGAFLSVRNRREAIRELRWLTTIKSAATAGDGAGSKLTRLLDINQRLNSELNLDKLLEYIIDSAILLTGAERGFLLMVEGEGEDALKIRVARNIDRENIRNKRYKVSYSIAQKVIETGEALLTTDAMADDRYSDYLSIHHMRLRSVLCLPMVRQGTVMGAMYIDNRFQTNAFTDDELAFMEAFADQAAIALSNAQLLEDRKSALGELAASQAEIEALNTKLEADLAQTSKALTETEHLLVVQRRQIARAHDGYENIVGDSAVLRQVFSVLDRVSQSDVPVQIAGASGTGKELVARAIHYNGARKDKPWIAINCSSIPETLIESELFGHVRGAFTGATSDKKGVFEAASGGTLFLDEIGEMPLDMQAKLLRALQEGEIQKVGSPRVVKVDVRIIAATNRNLRQMVKDKTFREDLFYRLAVVTIELPSLSDRLEDVPLLVQHFLEQNKREGLCEVTSISSEAMKLLMRYTWPGNIRELEMAVKNASIFCETDVLMPQDFSNFPAIAGNVEAAVSSPSTKSVRPLAELERDAIIHALQVYGGNKKRTAEHLGIDRRTLYNKLAAYGISVERSTHVLGKDKT